MRDESVFRHVRPTHAPNGAGGKNETLRGGRQTAVTTKQGYSEDGHAPQNLHWTVKTMARGHRERQATPTSADGDDGARPPRWAQRGGAREGAHQTTKVTRSLLLFVVLLLFFLIFSHI